MRRVSLDDKDGLSEAGSGSREERVLWNQLTTSVTDYVSQQMPDIGLCPFLCSKDAFTGRIFRLAIRVDEMPAVTACMHAEAGQELPDLLHPQIPTPFSGFRI